MAQAMPAFPKHFSYYINKLAGGFHKNKVRLQPISGSTISPNQTFQVRLPTNALIVPDSFNVYADIVIPGHATLPQHGLSSLFNRVDVRINGSSVHQGGILNWNNLYNIMFACQGSKEMVRKNVGLNRAQPVIWQDIDDGAGKTVPSCCSEWVGTWLSSCRPGVQSTQLLGEVIVEILTESTNKCFVGNATYAANATEYSLSNVYATIEVISFDNDVYLPMLYSRIQAGEFLPVLYTHVNDFQQSATGTGDLRVSVASNCLDMILVSHRLSSEQIAGNAIGDSLANSIIQNNVKRGKQFCSRMIASQTDAGTNYISQYQFQVDGQLIPANPVNTTKESYNHLLRVLGSEDNLLTNNLLYETYEMRSAGNASTVFANVVYFDIPGCKTKSATATDTSTNWVTPLTSQSVAADWRYNPYYNGNFFAGLSLRDESISRDENYLAGYSTKGSVAEILYKLTVSGTYAPLVDVYAFQTAVMNVGASQVLRIEY